jgi:hypothetical protein
MSKVPRNELLSRKGEVVFVLLSKVDLEVKTCGGEPGVIAVDCF